MACPTPGFDIHHADKGYVLLNKWLPSSENQLPAGASHQATSPWCASGCDRASVLREAWPQVGIGAFVLNDAQEVLVVQERRGPLRGKVGGWPRLCWPGCPGGAWLRT